MYVKPLVLMDESLAEGIFAASGATDDASLSYVEVSNQEYWNGVGQRTYDVSVPENSDINLKFKVTLSERITNIWGLGGTWALSEDGKSAICTTYALSGKGSFTFQGNMSTSVKSVERIA